MDTKRPRDNAINEQDIRKSVFIEVSSSSQESHTVNNSTPNPTSAKSLLPFLESISVRKLTRKTVQAWDATSVGKLVSSIPGVGEPLANKMVEEDVDGESLLLLTQADLVSFLGMKLGPAVKVFNAIKMIRETED